ncbi:MAG: diguanylate cyclase response regulator [Gallionellales bacterium RIFOXYB12_FULL_54_9]|nr:MAG: diguanylate cyclase response regulator [Gallionellales bacterium RIFOXYB12_FULL_54_9]
MKVLVVEDSKVALKAICGYIEDMGVRPLKAIDGQTAIEVYTRERPDIVLLDIILPDTNGYEVAKEIRRLQGKDEWTAIIFLSVMSKDEDLARGIEVGGDDYIMKPVGSVVVQAKVRAMYRLVQMQRALVKLAGQLNDANQELQRLSMTDGLTGLANRRMFDESLAREWRRCLRHKKPMSIVMLDVDWFKKYNDRYGHQDGDECLRAVAGELARSAPRPSDLVARYGGEEFVMILGDTGQDGATWVASRIRQHVDALQLPHKDSSFGHVTVSCGVSSVMPRNDLTVDALVKSADNALFLSKNQGRNIVTYLDYGQI